MRSFTTWSSRQLSYKPARSPSSASMRRHAAPSSQADASFLSTSQLREFKEIGLLVLPDFATQEELEAMKQRANAIVEDFDPAEVAIFSTTKQEKLTSEYFLKSANNISCFFEEGAFDANGDLIKPKGLSINKIGHALHDLDPVFRDFSRSKNMKELYKALNFSKPLPVQSMYIFKQPSIGGPVVPHQDSICGNTEDGARQACVAWCYNGASSDDNVCAFLATEPLSCVGIWLAVEDATLENGCLFAASRSHQDGVRGRMVLDESNSGVTWGSGKPDFGDLTLEPLEVKAGTIIVLHGSNVHGSNANTSEISRHAYSMHIVEGDGSEWLPDNWLQRGDNLPFEPLY